MGKRVFVVEIRGNSELWLSEPADKSQFSAVRFRCEARLRRFVESQLLAGAEFKFATPELQKKFTKLRRNYEQ